MPGIGCGRSGARERRAPHGAGRAGGPGPIVAGTADRAGLRRAVVAGLRRADQIGSALNTSPLRSSGWNESFNAGSAISAIAAGVQPSLRCTVRIGRVALNRMISFIRVPNTWPETSFAASDDKNTAIGAFLSGVIFWIFASRACCSGVLAGIEPVIRLQANGAMQFDRTL